MKNYYEILKIGPNADEHTIKKAFHLLVRKYHPDSPDSQKSPDAEKHFRLIQEAYETLIDKKSRETYDKYVLKKHSILSKTKGESYADKAVKYYEYGREAYRTKKFHSASNAFQTALNLDPNNALYCSWLGITLSHIHGRLSEAKKWCEKAIEISPYHADYYVNLAIIYNNAGVKSKAERYLKEALKLDPDNKRARLWLEGKDKKVSLKNFLKKIIGRKVKK